MTLRYRSVSTLCLLAFTYPLLAADGRQSSPAPQAVASSQTLFSAQLVPVGESNTPSGSTALGAFGATLGNDSLSSGSVQVSQNRNVAVQLAGAAASATYSVTFCRFGFTSAAGCAAVGQIETNSNGDGTASLTFPASPSTADTWAGAFVLTRSAASSGAAAEFISGFAFPPTPPPPSTGVELTLTGEIQALNPRTGSFTLFGLSITIDTGATTKFNGAGIRSFTDLAANDVVQISGFTQSDGTIFASTVTVMPKTGNQ